MENSKNDKMEDMILNLRKKMTEIDEMTKELEKKRFLEKKNNPTKTKKILEEIRVPALELLK